MSPKSFVQFHQKGTEISWVQVRCPETDKETDRQTDMILEVPPPRGGSPKKTSTLFESSVKHHQHISRIFSKIQHIKPNIPLSVPFQQVSKPTNRLTHITEIQTYLDIVHQHHRNFYKNVSKRYPIQNQLYLWICL